MMTQQRKLSHQVSHILISQDSTFGYDIGTTDGLKITRAVGYKEMLKLSTRQRTDACFAEPTDPLQSGGTS